MLSIIRNRNKVFKTFWKKESYSFGRDSDIVSIKRAKRIDWSQDYMQFVVQILEEEFPKKQRTVDLSYTCKVLKPLWIVIQTLGSSRYKVRDVKYLENKLAKKNLHIVLLTFLFRLIKTFSKHSLTFNRIVLQDLT